MTEGVHTGARVRLNGHTGRVVSHWLDADAARRQGDDGRRVAIELNSGRVLVNVVAANVAMVPPLQGAKR